MGEAKIYYIWHWVTTVEILITDYHGAKLMHIVLILMHIVLILIIFILYFTS